MCLISKRHKPPQPKPRTLVEDVLAHKCQSYPRSTRNKCSQLSRRCWSQLIWTQGCWVLCVQELCKLIFTLSVAWSRPWWERLHHRYWWELYIMASVYSFYYSLFVCLESLWPAHNCRSPTTLRGLWNPGLLEKVKESQWQQLSDLGIKLNEKSQEISMCGIKWSWLHSKNHWGTKSTIWLSGCFRKPQSTLSPTHWLHQRPSHLPKTGLYSYPGLEISWSYHDKGTNLCSRFLNLPFYFFIWF